MRRLLALVVGTALAGGVGLGLAQSPGAKPPAGKPNGKATASAQTPAARAAQPAPAPVRLSAPPLPAMGFAPGRPVDQARAVYEFAGQHPEILKYVPCYCGCESSGHPHNESCFVKRRDMRGNVLEWDTHGYG